MDAGIGGHYVGASLGGRDGDANAACSPRPGERKVREVVDGVLVASDCDRVGKRLADLDSACAASGDLEGRAGLGGRLLEHPP